MNGQDASKNRNDEYDLLNRRFDELFPICRSITGPGFKQSLEILKRDIPLEDVIFPTGAQVFDWKVPNEWEVRSAKLIGPDGQTYCDFEQSNLSVLNFSTAVDQEISYEDLQPHLFSISELPDATPYVTSYFKPQWGFCLPHSLRSKMPRGQYRVQIDSAHKPGSLVCGHYLLEGESKREILLSSYLCHPSLANNELSGPLCLMLLYRRLKNWKNRRYSYRFLINPETIGSISYLSRFGEDLKQRMEAGLVLTCMGGPHQSLTYKLSRRTNSSLDRLMKHLNVHESNERLKIRDFSPLNGSDERQYCSPGFNLPVGQIARTPYLEYDGYHNSLDTKEFMGIDTLIDSVDRLEKILYAFEWAQAFVNQNPFCEPQLGRRDLYPTTNSHSHLQMSSNSKKDNREFLNQVLAVLNYSDGEKDLVWIADRMGWFMPDLIGAVEVLLEKGLLRQAEVGGNENLAFDRRCSSSSVSREETPRV